MKPWRPGDPLPIPICRAVPDPPAGQALLYVDQRTRQPVIAVGARRRVVSCEDFDQIDNMSRQAASSPSARAGTAARALTLSSVLGGFIARDIAVSGAEVGMLVSVSYAGTVPGEVTGPPMASVTEAGIVRVAVPLAASSYDVQVAVLVAVESL